MKMRWGNLVVLVGVIVVLHAQVMRKSIGWLEDEKSALLHIKHSLFLQNASLGYPMLSSWDLSDPKSNSCEWEGVLCDSSSGHLITLSLFNLSAATYVDDERYNYIDCPEYYSMSLNMSLFLPFHQLTILNLSFNCFHHLFAIQDGQSNSTFSMLESLDLSWNPYLNENIIKSLTAFTSLKNLNLARCNISGPFPIQDGRSNSTFPMLETLDLSDNHELKESSIINSLSALTSLKNLNLASCNISGSFLMEVIKDGRNKSTFSMLENLDLSGNRYLNGSIIKPLTALTSLKNLNLAMCNISGPFPIKEFSVFRNLEVLDLSFNYLSSPSSTVQDLCKMIELQELNLSNNDLNGTLDACLGNLTSLRALDVSHNSLSGSIRPSLFALPSLEYLSLSDNNFEGLSSMNSLANNSKLKVLSLGDIFDNHKTKTFQVEIENPHWIPLFQLEYLDLSSCLSLRNIPTFLLYQHALKSVHLSNNNLVGMFPYWLLVNNSRSLTSVSLDGNSFHKLQLPSHLNQPFDQLVFLNLSNNKFQGNLPTNIGYFLPHLEYLNVSSNMFDGDIPISIGEMSYLKVLDLSNNSFSGKIPKDILIRCFDLKDLRLSHNMLEGNIFPAPLTNLGSLNIFLANNNQFNGTLLKDGVLFRALVVDISSNNLSGMLPSLIAKSICMLSVSRNNFEGEIPVDLCKKDQLTILDLSHNRFSGTIPSCLFNLSSLRIIDLGSNNLIGTIPESRDSSFRIIDLSNNQISGSIPKSFYRHSILQILSLANNKLEGQLSSEICELHKINILDLSYNKFTGSIPSCFNNMSFGNYSLQSYFMGLGDSEIGAYYYNSHFWFNTAKIYWLSFGEYEVQLVTKGISLQYKGDMLMSGLDLSSNELIGKIPHQIGKLHALHSLNLSHNHLKGTIPESLHNLKEIESLDLSYNNLTGEIPLQLQDLHFLSNFNVCFNNLSGRAPNEGQFANFDESNYKGNPHLSWSNSNRLNATPVETPLKNITEGSDCVIDLIAFYWSFGASYVMVLLTLVTILWINPRWRNVWFYYISICLQKSFGRFFDDAFFYHD